MKPEDLHALQCQYLEADQCEFQCGNEKVFSLISLTFSHYMKIVTEQAAGVNDFLFFCIYTQ